MSAPDPNLPPTPQEWLTPASLPYDPYASYAGAYGTPPYYGGRAIFELRPLNLGEVLDRTFSLYRSRFWLFAGIAAFSGWVQGLAVAGQVLTQSRILNQTVNHAPVVTDFLGPLLTLSASFLFFLAYSVTSAATVFAVGEVYLGRNTSVMAAMRATIGRWYAYIAIAIWQVATMAWVPFALMIPGFVLLVTLRRVMWLGGLLVILGVTAGLVVGYILYLRNAFGVPAAVTERLKIRAAMRHSKVLSSGAKVRIFVMHLISFALYMVVGIVQMPFRALMMFATLRHHALAIGPEAIVVVIGFLGHTVVTPVAAIGLTLLYFDQRVRKEAFDIAVLLGEEQALEAGTPLVNTPPEAFARFEPTVDSQDTQAGDAPLL